MMLPPGLYSLAAISSYLSSQFTNNGQPANLFSLSDQGSSGLAYITILTNGDTANFAQVGSIASILGFPALVIVAPKPHSTETTPT